MPGGVSTAVTAKGSGGSVVGTVTVDPPDPVAVPELRKGPAGVKGFVAPDTGGCAVPVPMPGVPVKKLPLGRPVPGPTGRPVGTTCTDPAPDQPGGGAGVSTSKPDPGALPEPDAGQATDQAVGVPAGTCLRSDSDQPVSSPADDVPPTGSAPGAGDAVAAQEDGATGSIR